MQYDFHVWPDGATGFFLAKSGTHDLVVCAASVSAVQRQVLDSFAGGMAQPSDNATFVSHEDVSTVPAEVVDHTPGYLTGE